MERRRERKQRLRELLGRRALGELVVWSRGEPAALSALVSLLLAPDPLLRWRSIEALGELAAARAAEGELDVVRDLVRRQLWSMNDESGNQAWHAAEEVGEVLHRVPELAPSFAPNLFCFVATYPFEAGVCFAIGRLGGRAPSLVGIEVREALHAAATHPSPAVRGHAAWALGELRDRSSADLLRPLLADSAPAEHYRFESGELELLPVGELVRRALEAFC